MILTPVDIPCKDLDRDGGWVKFLLKSDITFHLNYSCFRREFVGAAAMNTPACVRPCSHIIIIKMQIESVPASTKLGLTNGALISDIEKYLVFFLLITLIVKL